MKTLFTFLALMACISVRAQTVVSNSSTPSLVVFSAAPSNVTISSGGGSPSLSIAFVQDTNYAKATTGTLNLTAGHTVMVFAFDLTFQGATPATSVTDSQGNSYSLVVSHTNPNTSTPAFGSCMAAFIAFNVTGGSDTITIHNTGSFSGSWNGFNVAEYNKASAVNAYVAADTSGTTVSLPFTATQTFAIVASFYCYAGYSGNLSAASYSSTSWVQRNASEAAGDGQSCWTGDWLNGGAGYSATSGTATMTIAGSGNGTGVALILQ